MQFIGVVWVVYATGYALLGALAFAIAFVYAQVTVNDFVIARYTADAWRARVYAVRYFITYVISGAAITMIAFLHSRGGFDLVLTATAVIAVGFLDRHRCRCAAGQRCRARIPGRSAGRVAGSEQLRREIDDARAGALMHHLGDAGAVAAVLVALVAEQAYRLP
jgi:hypothetical protein